MSNAPRIVITVADPATQARPEVSVRKNDLYAEAIRLHGGDPILVHATTPRDDCDAAFAAMDGLLLAGGADLDPTRYGQPNQGSHDLEPERDELEADAWRVAAERATPVFGICRGFQVINVLMGGRLLQDVAGHSGPAWGDGPALRHPLRLAAGSRLARILSPTNAGGGVLAVNSYHHQAVRRQDLAEALVAAGWSPSPVGDIVEAIESRDQGRLLIGVQCHPERTESTPAAFDRLWRVFVDACRGPASGRTVQSRPASITR
jgi:putative glutamine amidotransferase